MTELKKNELPQAKVYIEGRYRKLTRDLPQTVFFCPECKGHARRRRGCARCEGFGKLTRDSVQELVGWVFGAAFKTRKNVFHGAGREDVDVRMLGEGRPFIMEMINPKNLDVDLAALEDEVNRRNAGRLELAGLHWTEKSRIRAIKETPHAKEYEARIRVDGDVDPQVFARFVGERLKVTQKTPARVAHRRADKDRERWIEFVSFSPVERAAASDGAAAASEIAPDASTSGSEWRVRLRTEHGTYVKEVINGESGSTTPSLSELVGLPCQCVELDVLAILDVEGRAEEVRRAPLAFGQNL
jgi:tRNA pseudouridine synthase 10